MQPSKSLSLQIQQQQQLNAIMQQLALAKTQLRKQQTREKIQLGGLIVKAQLAHEDKATLLGLLLEAQQKLASASSDNTRRQWRELGQAAFQESQRPPQD